MDVATINQIVRSQLSDQNADYADDPYLQPKLTLCYAEIANRLRLCNPDFDEYTVEIPNVLAGTPDLTGFSGAGQALNYLIEPIRIEWRLPGQDATFYQSAEKLSKVRDILAPGISAVDSWSWTHLSIFLSRFNVNLDLRVTGEFLLPPLSTGADQVLIGLNALPAIAYSILQAVAMERGNQQWVTSYGAKADENFDTLNIGMCKGRQGKTDRAGRMDRQRRRRSPGGNGIA